MYVCPRCRGKLVARKGEMENSRSVVIFQSADLLLRNVFQKRKRKNRPPVSSYSFIKTSCIQPFIFVE